MSHIVIIGNGIAGITAARHIRRHSNDEITVISGETDHFYSRTALMYIFMGHMKYEHTKPYEDWFWDKNRINLKRAWVTSIDFKNKSLHFSENRTIAYDKLILATGSKSNKFGWPGQDLEGVQSLYSYQDLELMEDNSRGITRAVIVGGGLIGIEMTEMLHSRGIHVTYLVREKHFWDIVFPDNEAQLIENHILEHGIELRLSTELSEILDDGNGRVKAAKTQNGETIPCQFVGLTVGVSPNIDLVRNTELETDKGILVDQFLETNIPDVYALGDCAQLRNPNQNRRAIEAIWYTGRMMGETVAKTLTGHKTAYDPGVWFNSAKFFDIEYQTYGHVWPSLRENESDFYWESDDGRKCLHFVFSKQGQHLFGVNALGIRLRHEVLDSWIRAKASMDHVIEHIKDVNFDPELFKSIEPEILGLYNQQFNKSIRLKKKNWKNILNPAYS